jgi:predicted acyl esterase
VRTLKKRHGRAGDARGDCPVSSSIRPNPHPPSAADYSLGAGRFDNTDLESRDDVLIFTSGPPDTDVDVIGKSTVNIAVSVDNRFSDTFVRLTDLAASSLSLPVIPRVNAGLAEKRWI